MEESHSPSQDGEYTTSRLSPNGPPPGTVFIATVTTRTSRIPPSSHFKSVSDIISKIERYSDIGLGVTLSTIYSVRSANSLRARSKDRRLKRYWESKITFSLPNVILEGITESKHYGDYYSLREIKEMCTPDWVADWVNVTLCPYEEWPEEVPRDMVDDGSDSKSEGEDGDEEMTDADDDGNQVERLGERMDGVGLGS